MGWDPGAAQLQLTGLPVPPTRVQGAQPGRCLSSSCSTVRDTELECRRINLPSGIDNSVLCFWHELITEPMHWFAFWLRLNRVKGFPTDEVYTWIIFFLPVRGEWEGKQYAAVICLFAALINCSCVWWRSGWYTGAPNKGLYWRKLWSLIHPFLPIPRVCYPIIA